MALDKCPRCGSKVQPTDSVCLDCGLDLIAAREKIVAEAQSAAPAPRPAVAVTNPAAAGLATDVGEATRLREFDEELAEKLRGERAAALLTALISLCAGLAFLWLGRKLLAQVGGWRALPTLTSAYLRERGFGLFADPLFLAALALGLALAGLLTAAGQFHRTYTGTQAIEDIRFGGRPRVVGISAFTTLGLLLASFLLPPVGLLLGLIFKLSDDPDTRDLGGRMVTVSLLAVGLFVVNLLWGFAAGLKNLGARHPHAAP
jgi:hypothetical protein